MALSLKCSLCSVASHLRFSVTDYIKHLRLFHVHQPDFKFTCPIDGCQKVYSNIGSFKNHVSARHIGVNQADDNSLENNSDHAESLAESNTTGVSMATTQESMELMADNVSVNRCDLQKNSAYFLLELKEKRKLTQVAIQSVVEGCTSIMQKRTMLLKRQGSCLPSVQLVAIVKASFIGTYGMDAILRPFINDMKKLVSVHNTVLSPMTFCFYPHI